MSDLDNLFKTYKKRKLDKKEEDQKILSDDRIRHQNAINNLKEKVLPILKKYVNTIQNQGYASKIQDTWTYNYALVKLLFQPIPKNQNMSNPSSLCFNYKDVDKINVQKDIKGSGVNQPYNIDWKLSEMTENKIKTEIEKFIEDVLDNN